MSNNRLGAIATLGILGLGTLGIYAAPLASAHTDCVMDGARLCAPGNDRGVPAGCYDEGGVLVALWPCEGNQKARWGVGLSKYSHDDQDDERNYEDTGHHGSGGHHTTGGVRHGR